MTQQSESEDGLLAIVEWLNGDVMRSASITSHVAGCRVTLSEGLLHTTRVSREGTPHETALSAVKAIEKPSTQRRFLREQVREAERHLLAAQGELRGRERALSTLQKQLDLLEGK